MSNNGPIVQEIAAAVYVIPTDSPEADGTLAWDETLCSTGSAEPRTFEGAFMACSFWLVDALVRNGHADQARKLWHDLTGYASDLGLFAEEIDPATGAFLGNMPQGLSHLALLNAAALLNGP